MSMINGFALDECDECVQTNWMSVIDVLTLDECDKGVYTG